MPMRAPHRRARTDCSVCSWPASCRADASKQTKKTNALRPISGSTNTSLRPLSRTSARFCKPFIAIQGQCAQLLQVALLPAVGASMKRLPGAAMRILCRMPLSVATMNSSASGAWVAAISCEVEPTTSASATTPAGDSGCTSTFACGCSRLSNSSSMDLNSSCTMHEPCHNSMSAPDKHLGSYIQKQTGADMLLWQGSCIVHDEFKSIALELLKRAHPQAKVLVHPESPAGGVAHADVVGSTSQLIAATQAPDADEFIVA